MNKYFSFFLLVLFSSAAFADNFQIGDTVLDNYAGSVQKGQILEITSGGLVQTTNTAGTYIKINRLAKYESVNSFRTGNLLSGYRTYKIGDLVFDTYANTTFFGGVSMWNLGEILDITPDGLVKTSNTINAYIDIGRLEKYAKVSTYEVKGWLGSGSVVFRVGDEVVDNFAGTYRFGVIQDISSNGLVRTTNTTGKYVKIDRLQAK
jgi:hypothetical protein